MNELSERIGDPVLVRSDKNRVGERLQNGAWCLAVKKTHEFKDPGCVYNYFVLTFHSGAGREDVFAVGRCTPWGQVNPMTYEYYDNLPYAYAAFTHERSQT